MADRAYFKIFNILIVSFLFNFFFFCASFLCWSVCLFPHFISLSIGNHISSRFFQFHWRLSCFHLLLVFPLIFPVIYTFFFLIRVTYLVFLFSILFPLFNKTGNMFLISTRNLALFSPFYYGVSSSWESFCNSAFWVPICKR